MQPNKLLGQNFMRCSWVPILMVKSSDLGPDDVVLEIGPGTGILTKELLTKAKKVIAIEKDKKLVKEFLEDLSNKHSNLEIVTGDVLKNLSEVAKTYNLKPSSYKLVANIPYYLTSHLLRILLEQGPQPNTIVLTIQKEVAERICATPPKTNLLALSVQVFGKPKIIKTVPADCFWPKPSINSAILKISEISDIFFKKNSLSPSLFFELVKAGFAHKRKTLLNSLSFLTEDKDDLRKILVQAELTEKTRAEEMSLDQWVKLSKKWPTKRF